MDSNSVQKCKVCGQYLTMDHFRKIPWAKSGDAWFKTCNKCSAAKRVAAVKSTSKDRSFLSSNGSVLKPVYTSASDVVAVSDDRFAGITSRELLVELAARGYKWTDMYIEKRVITRVKVKL